MTEIDDSKTLKPIKTERRDKFTNLSDIEIKPLYTPEDIKNINYDKDLGSPGKFPFTRGAYPNMYRGRLWTMRQFAGFGTAAQTNLRYKFLLEHGTTGLSVAFSLHTIYGYQADDDEALGEVGKEGVSIDTLKDFSTNSTFIHSFLFHNAFTLVSLDSSCF